MAQRWMQGAPSTQIIYRIANAKRREDDKSVHCHNKRNNTFIFVEIRIDFVQRLSNTSSFDWCVRQPGKCFHSIFFIRFDLLILQANVLYTLHLKLHN